jgi:hypothetical protein
MGGACSRDDENQEYHMLTDRTAAATVYIGKSTEKK